MRERKRNEALQEAGGEKGGLYQFLREHSFGKGTQVKEKSEKEMPEGMYKLPKNSGKRLATRNSGQRLMVGD